MKKELFDTNNIILPNGINLISIKRDTQIAAVHIGIKVGSLYEKKNEKGISHFIEHMLFKGTKSRNNEKLNSDLEERGGEYNAYTDFNSTVYSITALSEEIEVSVELLGDMIMNSTFPEKEIERERGVILAEIRTSKDDVEDFSFRKIHEAAFKKSPLRYDTIGEEKTVKKFSRQELIDFYSQYYVPNNCVISIVSPFEHEYISEIVLRYFEGWKSKELYNSAFIIEDNIPIKKTTYKKEIEQSTIIYAYTFHNINKEEELALKILNHKLGESANSVLFRELREERGLAYDVYSQLDTSKYVKTLYIYTAVSFDNIDETLDIIDKCIQRIKTSDIRFDDGTISLMKKVLKTAVASTMEDSTDLGNYVLHQAIDDESIYEFENDMKNLENISKDDIYMIANKVLNEPTIHILLSEKVEN
ncbi:MAG: pitrilysin family protein [Bacillota bacterium]|nr:pitrilysin family protein [Bacillota bacterium]